MLLSPRLPHTYRYTQLYVTSCCLKRDSCCCCIRTHTNTMPEGGRVLDTLARYVLLPFLLGFYFFYYSMRKKTALKFDGCATVNG